MKKDSTNQVSKKVIPNNTFSSNKVPSKDNSVIQLKSDIEDLSYENNKFISVGSLGKLLTSIDGINWHEMIQGSPWTINSIAWGAKRYVGVGDQGITLTSENGTDWAFTDTGTGNDLRDVIWDGHQFVACGNGFVFKSEKGIGWTKVELPKVSLDNGSGEDKTYDASVIFYDGKQYIVTGGGNFILTSPDLKKWAVRIPDSMGTGSFCDLAWNGKQYVGVGDHLALVTSSDGQNWDINGSIDKIESVDDYYTLCLNSVAWGKDKFVAVGQRGLIITSDDGIKWTIVPSITRKYLNKVVWDGKKFIAAGDAETIITSADGVNWKVVNGGQ
ncbi:MAG: hypothetical protein Q8920_10890 [Bacillota bacterium]|nr:hypothetical protein [Bacillota bacterium]